MGSLATTSVKLQRLRLTVALALALGVLTGIAGPLGPSAVLVAVGFLAVIALPVEAAAVLATVPFLYNIAVIRLGGLADIRVLQLLWVAVIVGLIVRAAAHKPVESWTLPRGLVLLAGALLFWETLAALRVGGAHSLIEVAQTGYLFVVAMLVARFFGTQGSQFRRRAALVGGWALLATVAVSLLGFLVPSVAVPHIVVTAGPGLSVATENALNLAASQYGIQRFALVGLGPVASASVFLVALAVSMAIVFQPNRKTPALAWAVALASGMGLILTLSRAGWLVGILVVLVLAARSGARRLVAGLAVLLVIVLLLLSVPSISARFMDITDANEGSNRSHTRLWETAIFMAQAEPVFGWGPGQFSVAARGLGQGDTSVNIDSIDAHNFLLQEAAETGWPGALILAMLLGATALWVQARIGWEVRPELGVTLALLALLAMGMTMNILRTEVLWSVVGVALGLSYAAGKRDSSKEMTP